MEAKCHTKLLAEEIPYALVEMYGCVRAMKSVACFHISPLLIKLTAQEKRSPWGLDQRTRLDLHHPLPAPRRPCRSLV
jgi:hypothetical protein